MVKRAGATSALIFGLLGAAHAAGPSFDCARVKAGSVEALICGSDLLSALDAEMARLYWLARSAYGGASLADLKKRQIKWLKIRNECLEAATSSVCLRDRYLGRIASLRRESALARS